MEAPHPSACFPQPCLQQGMYTYIVYMLLTVSMRAEHVRINTLFVISVCMSELKNYLLKLGLQLQNRHLQLLLHIHFYHGSINDTVIITICLNIPNVVLKKSLMIIHAVPTIIISKAKGGRLKENKTLHFQLICWCTRGKGFAFSFQL